MSLGERRSACLTYIKTAMAGQSRLFHASRRVAKVLGMPSKSPPHHPSAINLSRLQENSGWARVRRGTIAGHQGRWVAAIVMSAQPGNVLRERKLAGRLALEGGALSPNVF